jgi:acyl-CoA dehydrogenase
MVDFYLSEEQKSYVKLAREFSSNEIAPVALDYDKDGDYPEEILKKAKDLGLMYTNIPKEYGGTGMDYVAHYCVQEALNYDCCAIGQMIGISHLATGPILLGGTDEQKRQFLGDMTKSYRSAAFCLTEPEAGSDVGSMQTTADKNGGEYRLNGAKCYITNGLYADLLCVFATIDKSLGSKGISCFAVPRGTKGVSYGRVEDKMGHRALNVAEVSFDNVIVSEENLIGSEGQGFKLAMMALDRGRANITAICTGISQKAFDLSCEHARNRKQFGTNIGSFQAIQSKLADMYAAIQSSRALYLKVGWMIDEGLPCSTETAASKVFASDAAMKITTDAVQILGGSGYMKDSFAQKLMRDAKLTQIFEGTNEINRVVAGRGVLRKRPAQFFI